MKLTNFSQAYRHICGPLLSNELCSPNNTTKNSTLDTEHTSGAVRIWHYIPTNRTRFIKLQLTMTVRQAHREEWGVDVVALGIESEVV